MPVPELGGRVLQAPGCLMLFDWNWGDLITAIAGAVLGWLARRNQDGRN